jgi:hypothetical protein
VKLRWKFVPNIIIILQFVRVNSLQGREFNGYWMLWVASMVLNCLQIQVVGCSPYILEYHETVWYKVWYRSSRLTTFLLSLLSDPQQFPRSPPPSPRSASQTLKFCERGYQISFWLLHQLDKWRLNFVTRHTVMQSSDGWRGHQARISLLALRINCRVHHRDTCRPGNWRFWTRILQRPLELKRYEL